MGDAGSLNVADIKDVVSEAGVIATIIQQPDMVFNSEQLNPHYFSDRNNGYLYYAISELAKRGVDRIDTYNIVNILNAKPATQQALTSMTEQAISDCIAVAPSIARHSVEEYMVLVDKVMDMAFRREAYNKLVECERMCFNSSVEKIEEKISTVMDDVVLRFSTAKHIPQYKDVVDSIWSDIVSRQEGSTVASIPFFIPELNKYVTLEPQELVVVGANAKVGKSMFLLNAAVDMIDRGLKVMYIDSELSERLFATRLMSRLTGIEFARVKSGRYTEEEAELIRSALNWLKPQEANFTHLYMPVFDPDSVFTAIKKVSHTQGLDAIIIDYFKSGGETDGFATYQKMGDFVDLIKNRCCGDMGLIGLGAAQTTATGKLADSAKIARNASTILTIEDKTLAEIEQDGAQCGNKKLVVRLNRNGPQMTENEYIDLDFDGNRILYQQAEQHVTAVPF